MDQDSRVLSQHSPWPGECETRAWACAGPLAEAGEPRHLNRKRRHLAFRDSSPFTLGGKRLPCQWPGRLISDGATDPNHHHERRGELSCAVSSGLGT